MNSIGFLVVPAERFGTWDRACIHIFTGVDMIRTV
jgi:hypothetical protein